MSADAFGPIQRPAGPRAPSLSRKRFLRLAIGAAAAAVAPPLGGRADARVLPQQHRGCACGSGARSLMAMRAFENRIGWAYTARPGTSRGEILADLRRMKELDCNTLYVGHNNPGNTDPDGIEPGIAPAVWYAIARNTPQASNARRIYQAVVDVLEAARVVGLDVVLAIGYQIQMGEEWNSRHRDELRRDRDGQPLSHWGSGETASPYSERYRQDVAEYYAWVDQNLVRPYQHVVALNLADEPMGSDLSPHAMAAFQGRYGRPFGEATDYERGEFLSGVIADYAAWSANAWKALNPEMRTMMTFHIQREAPFLPDVERIFAQTPDTFVFSADTHLDDGLIDRAITAEGTNLLYGMVRTLSWLSRVYGKPLMLWTSANAWGLKRTGGPSEALRNLEIVHDTAKQGGGQLGMVMAWGWNIRGQGVYDDQGNFPRDKDQMIGTLAQAMAARREQLSRPTNGRPDRVVYAPASYLYPLIGERQLSHLAEGLVDLSGVDFVNQNVVYLTDGAALDEARRLGATVVSL